MLLRPTECARAWEPLGYPESMPPVRNPYNTAGYSALGDASGDGDPEADADAGADAEADGDASTDPDARGEGSGISVGSGKKRDGTPRMDSAKTRTKIPATAAIHGRASRSPRVGSAPR
jgi:hypothetical protein